MIRAFKRDLKKNSNLNTIGVGNLMGKGVGLRD